MRIIVALTNQRLIHAHDHEKRICLTGPSGVHIVRLVIKNNQVFGEKRLLASEGQCFRYSTQEPAGEAVSN